MLLLKCGVNVGLRAIQNCLNSAFGRESEGDLVAAIYHSPNFIPELSIAAVEDEQVWGYILFSPIKIESEQETVSALALAPLAVHPSHHRQGIGSQLVRAGIEQCRALNHSLVVVLGHPDYYQRFGFQTASRFDIHAPFSVPDEAFMVLELQAGILNQTQGVVRYPDYFNTV